MGRGGFAELTAAFLGGEHMKRPIAAAAMLVFAGLPAAAQTPIKDCHTVISQPGRYQLVADLNCNQTALSITAGETTQMVGSPTPPQKSPLGTITVSTRGMAASFRMG